MSREVNVETLEPGDIIYESNGTSIQIVVLTAPTELEPYVDKFQTLRRFRFTGRINGGVIEFISTPGSPYDIRLNWEPQCPRVYRVDGSVWTVYDK